MKKTHFESVSVFDLDGTLYYKNSHLEILHCYFRTKIFESFPMKAIGKLWLSGYMRILNFAYGKIPLSYRNNFLLDFRPEILSILNSRRTVSKVLILSNGPKEIINNAARSLNVVGLQAPIGRKLDVLNNYCSYTHLFACTDNPTDMDILKAAEKRVILISPKTKRKFSDIQKEAGTKVIEV